MKKTAGVIFKILAGCALLILILLFSVPVIFKERIRSEVEKVIAGSLNASVKFGDYKLGFFRDFPNLSFSLNDLSVVGNDKFSYDTLAAIQSFNMVFNLSSLFKKTGYEVKSIMIDRARVNTIVLKDGSANWDIMKDTSDTDAGGTEEETSDLKIVLKKVSITNSSISYLDDESDMSAYLDNINFILKGDMTGSGSDLQMEGKINEFTFIMEGMKYLNRVVVDSRFDFLADFDKMKFTFRENYMTLNDLRLNFSGMVAMPGDDIETDITFESAKSAFGSLLSLIPAVYMKDYQDLRTGGEFSFSGTARGIYSDADSTMPDVKLSLSVSKGSVAYPSLPEKITNINIKSELFFDGKDMDRTTVNIDPFHFELAGSPFDMTFDLKTPVSDPDFKVSMLGRIDLSALSKALPMDSMDLSGIIDVSAKMAGRMSMIEKEQYESFMASGSLGIRDMAVEMKGYPDIKIHKAGLEFTPAYAAMTNVNLNIGGKSDFELNGHISDYIPYVFRNKTIKGKLSMRSKLIDATEIMSKMTTDTVAAEDTSSLALVHIPGNIDFDFDAAINEFRYDNIKGQNVKGHIILRDGVLSIRETGMDILKGTLAMNADYDTRDTLKPVMKADFDMQNIDVKEAFNTFNTVKKLAPAAQGVDGRIGVRLAFKSILGHDMMPLVQTIDGEGKLKSDEITLVESGTFDKVKEALKLGDKYNNTFRDVNVSFKIKDGRIYVAPFDVRTGNLKMNIAGDQGIDQTLNYIVRTEMPRSDLGSSVNSLIDNLAAQASAFGISYKPSEIIKVNLHVTGTFGKPAISPFFGKTPSDGASETKPSAKEAVKETISGATDKAREKARAEAEAEAARLVKEAEEKGQLLRDEAARAAENIRKEADTQARKLIDDNSKKSTIEKMAAQKGADALKKNADKKANQLVQEADVQAKKLVEEAKARGDEMVKKL